MWAAIDPIRGKLLFCDWWLQGGGLARRVWAAAALECRGGTLQKRLSLADRRSRNDVQQLREPAAALAGPLPASVLHDLLDKASAKCSS